MAGIITLDQVAFGNDATNTLNFHWKRPVTPDGSIALWRGTPSNPISKVLEINAAGQVLVNGTDNIGDLATRNLSVNGYQKLPGGMILQWGQVTQTGGAAYTTTNFPTTFPNAALSVVCTPNSTTGKGSEAVELGVVNASSFQHLTVDNTNAGFNAQIRFMAFGY